VRQRCRSIRAIDPTVAADRLVVFLAGNRGSISPETQSTPSTILPGHCQVPNVRFWE
jgi:hypothetical protein